MVKIRSGGYASYDAAAITELLGKNASKSAGSIRAGQTNQNTLVNKIEKHISDVKKGEGDASKDVASILSQQDANAASILSRTSPRALAMYSGYLSGLRYDRAARFVNGVEHGLSHLDQTETE